MKPKSNIVLSQLLYASKSFKPVLGNAFLSLSDGDQNRLIRKRWQELRRDPQFAELLAGPNDSSTPRQVVVLLQDAPVEYRPRPRGAIVVSCSEEMTPSIVLTLRSNNRLISMSPSCNGLVCIYDDLGMLLLFNPATKERLSLPRPPNDGFHAYHVLCHLVFLPLTMEYKAARVVSLLQDQSVITLCQVLTVGTISWRTICELDNSVEHDEDGVTIDGTLYWMSSKGYAKSREMAIHVFDVKYEGVRTIPLPNSEISDFRWETKLFEHDGSLCLFGRRQWQVNWLPSSDDYSLEEDDQIDVWMLKDANDCVWAHIYHDPNCYPEPNCR